MAPVRVISKTYYCLVRHQIIKIIISQLFYLVIIDFQMFDTSWEYIGIQYLNVVMRNIQVVDLVPHSVLHPSDVVVTEVEGEEGIGRYGVVCNVWYSSQESVTTVYDYMVCVRIMVTRTGVWTLVVMMAIVAREGTCEVCTWCRIIF